MNKLVQEQLLPISLDEAWDFFTVPGNLNHITPPDLVFEVTSELPEKVYAGLFITYRIKPMLNIPVNWCTEITHVEEKKFFVDEQRKGPYSIWHHEHHFKAIDDGVLMTDILHYHIGKSVFGWVAGELFVHKKVRYIFEYRREVLARYFNTSN